MADGDRRTNLNDKIVSLSHARFRSDKLWVPWTGTVREMSDKWFAKHKVGQKNGTCILQGKLVGSERSSKNVVANYTVMFDHDNGETIDEIEDKILRVGHAAILATTHSHMKPETEIDEDALLTFIEKNDLDPDDKKGAARAYLSSKKGVVDRILESITDVVLEHRQGGVKYVVKHAPMHRVRSLFILDEPYNFSGSNVSQKQRIEEWKSRYIGLANKLDVAVDPMCVDPARLMYLPRYAQGSDPSIHEIRFVEGNCLRWQDMPLAPDIKAQKTTRKNGSTRVDAAETTRSRGLPQLITKGLAKFIVDHSLSFQAADWLRDACREVVRREQDGKYTFECPLDDMHSDAGNPEDTGFFCVNGDPEQNTSWTMWCQHATCSAHTQKDRAAYLDAACVKYGITDADELLPYCLETSNRTVCPNDDFDDALERSRQLFEEGNAFEPRVYWNPFEARYCRIDPNKPDAIIEPLTNDGQWHIELRRHADFRDRKSRSIAAPSSLIGAIRGNASLRVPVCKGIVRVPQFSRDGSLRTVRGYDPVSQTFLDPWGQFLPVPATVSEEEITKALSVLSLALRDFPFSDVFCGADPAPVRVPGEVDEEGFPSPNYNRGVSSRAHALAMLLTAIVRPMIDGPTPIHLIDKPKPGTGAGYLLNLLSSIVTGGRAAVCTLGSGDEIGKQVTTKLRRGDPVLVFDNVNDHIDSAELAAAITGGFWQGRILGQSLDTNVEIKTVWTISCNYGSLSGELMRRTVPVRMDAATDDPARDRKPEYFKLHSLGFTYDEWLKQNKLQLVWALHVLAMNWLQARAAGYVYEGPVLASFDAYSKVIGGVLECCGVDGFLTNTSAYLESRNDERNAKKLAMQLLYDEFGKRGVAFTTSDALSVLSDPFDPSKTRLKFDILPPERADRMRRADGLGTALGRWLSNMVKQGVHRLPNGVQVSLTRKEISGVNKYELTIVD